MKINGADPDFHRRDLWDAITAGDFPEWELGVQLFDDDFADRFDFDVLDATKIIPEELVPVRRSGGWCSTGWSTTSSPRPSRSRSAPRTSSPGIDFTNDPLLQGRNFSYLDTQLKRLGSPNFTHLPVNAPKCPVAHFQQDGHMAMTQPGRARATTSRTRGRRRQRGPARTRTVGFTTFPADGARREAARPVGDASPTTTARPASSTSARRRSSSSTSSTRSSSS